VLSDLDKAYNFGGDLESAGYTLVPAINAIFAQGSGAIIAINVFDPSRHRTLGAAQATSGSHSLTSNIATITTDTAHGLSVGDFIEITGFTSALSPLNQNYIRIKTVPTTTSLTFDLTHSDITATTSTSGIIKKITFDPTLVTAADIIGAIDAAGNRSGMKAWRNARGEFGYVPRILIAPGFSTQESVAVEMAIMADKLRAHAIIDAPAGLTTQQIVNGRGTSGTINLETSSERVIICDNHVWVYNVATQREELQPLSSFMAGVMAATDNTEGYWVSPSNKEIKGINGVERVIEFDVLNKNSEANELNRNGIVTIVRDFGTGYILWGNRSAAFPTNPDPENFICVRRTMDIVHDSLGYGLRPFLDRPMTLANIDSALATINAFLRSRIAEGALIAANVRFERNSNPTVELAQGRIVFDMEHMPPTPMENIKINSRMNIELLEALFEAGEQL
jgi:phage tail sheath protein FI